MFPNISDDVATRITAEELLQVFLKYGRIVAKAVCANLRPWLPHP